MDLTNPLVYGVPFFLCLILLELAYSRSHDEEKHLYEWKDLIYQFRYGPGRRYPRTALQGHIRYRHFQSGLKFSTRNWRACRTNIMGYQSFDGTNFGCTSG